MKCLKCGTELSIGENFCRNCGELVEVPEIIDMPKVEQPEIIGMETINFKQSEVEVLGFEDINKSDKFFRKSILMGVVLSCLILILAIVGAIMIFSATPKKVFMVPINSLFDEAIKNMNADYKTVKGNMSIKMESNSKFLDIFNSLSLNVEYGIDYEKMLMAMDFNSSYDSKKLVNGKLYAENNNLYAYVAEVFSKYFKIPVEEQQFKQLFNSGSDTKEVKMILSKIQKALNKVLKDEYFTKEKEIVIIDGKEVKVTKSTLILNDNNIRVIAKDLLNLLKDDQEFISSFSKIGDMTESEVKSSIDDIFKKIDSSEVTNEEVKISIYTKGFNNKFVKLEVINVVDGKSNIIEVTRVDDNNYDYVLSIDGENVSGNVEIIENSDIKKVFKVITVNGNDTYTITFSSSFQYNVDVQKFDVSNSVALEELTEEDSNEIITNLMNHELFQSIFGILMGSMVEEY